MSEMWIGRSGMYLKDERVFVVLQSALSDKIERCQDGRDRRQEVYVRKIKDDVELHIT